MFKKLITISLFSALIMLITCKEIEKQMLVSTELPADIRSTSAEVGGIVIDRGSGSTQHGHYYSTNPGLDQNSLKTELGPPVKGVFKSELNNLEASTTYYYKAYISNGIETAYGDEKSFFTHDIPAVSFVPSPDVYSHKISATIQALGQDIVNKGICYSEEPLPLINDMRVDKDMNQGTVLCEILGLKSQTTYYLRPYATNAWETVYGDQIVLTTLPMKFDVEVTPYEIYDGCPTDGENAPYQHELAGNINTWPNNQSSSKINLGTWYNNMSINIGAWNTFADNINTKTATIAELSRTDSIGFDYFFNDWDDYSTNDYIGSATGYLNMTEILELDQNEPTSLYNGTYIMPHDHSLEGGCLKLTMKFVYSEKEYDK